MSKLSSFGVLSIFIGTEPYRLNEAVTELRQKWMSTFSSDHYKLMLTTPLDWENLILEASSYSLLTTHTLIEASFEKETLDKSAKALLSDYLNNPNPKNLIILRAPKLAKKHLTFLNHHSHVTISQFSPLSGYAYGRWLSSLSAKHNIQLSSAAKTLLQEYTENNLLAAAQVIEKIKLFYDNQIVLQPEDLLPHLHDARVHQTYELADACLNGLPPLIYSFLRKAAATRLEPTLVLWLITQEIRQLINLHHLMHNAVSFEQAIKQLNIWPSRANLYQKALKRLSEDKLYSLLDYANQIDTELKTTSNAYSWDPIERLAFEFSVTSIN